MTKLLYFIYGPPKTGKTEYLCKPLMQLFQIHNAVVVTSPRGVFENRDKEIIIFESNQSFDHFDWTQCELDKRRILVFRAEDPPKLQKEEEEDREVFIAERRNPRLNFKKTVPNVNTICYRGREVMSMQDKIDANVKIDEASKIFESRRLGTPVRANLATIDMGMNGTPAHEKEFARTGVFPFSGLATVRSEEEKKRDASSSGITSASESKTQKLEEEEMELNTS